MSEWNDLKDWLRALGKKFEGWTPPPGEEKKQEQKRSESDSKAPSVICGVLALIALGQAFSWEQAAGTTQAWIGTDGGYGTRALLGFLVAAGLGLAAWRLWPSRRQNKG